MPSDEKQYHKLEFTPQGVFLILDQDVFGDKGLLQQTLRSVAKKNLDQLDKDAIKAGVESKSTEPILVAPAQPEPIDGKVLAKLNEAQDQILIKIEPPMGRGRKAEIKDVMEAVRNAGAEKFFLDLEKIENMLASFRFRDFVPVGEKRDGRFEITVSQDGTEATMNLAPPFGGDPVEPGYVLTYLQNMGIKDCVNKDVINKLIADEIYNENVIIAKGAAPEDGEDGRLEYYFDPDADKPKPTINEEGEVDFKELNLFQKVKQGDKLVRKYPAKPGKPGRTVYGSEIAPKQGKDIPFPVGMNTKPSEKDKNLLIASMDGQPKVLSNKVVVVPIIEIPGDVDFSTGNIDFTGAVHIRGNVISGFTVKAMGDIQVGGCIEMATIECGGHLTVRAGVVGQDKALIICRGNITAKFIDKATVYADGDILVDESLMYSKVSSQGNIILAGKKGYIMGGVTRASKTIRCNQIGTQTQTPTLIEVGGSPTLREEMERIEQEIRDAEDMAKMQSKSLETMERRKQQGADLSEEQQQRIMHMSRERFALLSKLRSFKEKKEDMEEKLVRLRSSHLKVHVKKQVLPGSKICIKNAQWTAKDPLDFASFREYEGEIQFSPYEGE